MASRPALLAALLLCSGCITGGYSRRQVFAPITHERLAQLEVGKATLADALAAFGAPVLVWEWKGDGAAIAWGWSDSARWGFSISVPVGDSSATAYNFDKLASDLPGMVLFFGADDVLLEAREGRLADIRAETLQTRPAPPEGDPP